MLPGAEIQTDAPSQSTEQLWRLPIGAASPLWGVYATAAGAGVAYWWMSRLMRPFSFQAQNWQVPNPYAYGSSFLAQTLAALQPEPVPPPADPAVDPAEPAAVMVETAVNAVQDLAEAGGEAAIAMSLAADDLTRLTGIGPTLAGRLAEVGVRTFADIASWTDQDMERVDRELELRGRAVRENWVEQARQFAAQ